MRRPERGKLRRHRRRGQEASDGRAGARGKGASCVVESGWRGRSGESSGDIRKTISGKRRKEERKGGGRAEKRRGARRAQTKTIFRQAL